MGFHEVGIGRGHNDQAEDQKSACSQELIACPADVNDSQDQS
jgi:hypothetical protein